MALNKVNYVDGQTVITAENLNDIQDAIIALENAPAQGLTEDMKQALLQLARKLAYIDDQGQTYYDDLYDALYPPKTVVLITAVFEQGSTVIYDDTALNDLKQYLTVTAKYDDNTTAILADSAYTLSGLLEAGTSTVTVLYSGLTTTFTVSVTARPTLSSISADYTQSGTVYDTDTLDSLKADLVVTAHYSDSSTATVAADDYALSGTLTSGTSTITVSYGGKTTTFNVTVTEHIVNGWYYQFDNSLLSSGNHDFGFSGVQNYAQGIDGECYFHEVGTEGDATTDPLGLYALQSADAPTWGSNDFTIAGWQKCVTPMRGHLFAASQYVSTDRIYWDELTIQAQDSNWTVDPGTYITKKYAGVRLGTVSAKLSVDITNASVTNGREIKVTPPSSFDSTQWHHYALTRSGNTLYYFVDGHLIWTAVLPAGTEIYSSNYITLGNFMSENTNNTVTQYPYSAYYDDLYVNVGSAKWTQDFDPTTIEY